MDMAALNKIRRKFRQRFGISAPRVGVRRELPWFWKLAILVGGLVLALILSLWGYDAGGRMAGFDSGAANRDLAHLNSEVVRLDAGLKESLEAQRAAEGRLQVEMAAIVQITKQLRDLQKENALMREELALFEGLVSRGGGGAELLSIARASIEPASISGRYRFHVMLVRSPTDRAGKELAGELQFSLRVRRGIVDDMISVPGVGNPSSSFYQVVMKYLHRAEGEFSLLPESKLLGGEVRFLQGGVVKARQAFVTK